MALAVEIPASTSDAPSPDRVLVVDDETAIVGVETEILRAAGFDTVGVTRPEDALALPVEGFDVVVTDYRMPEVNGLALFQDLRRRNPQLVGVLVTGFGSLKLVQTAMAAGFNAILLKPFPLERLTSAVERALRQQRLTDENRRLEAILEVYTTGQDLNRPRSRAELAALLAQMARDSVAAPEAAVLLNDLPDNLLKQPLGSETSGLRWVDALVEASPQEAVESVLKQEPEAAHRLALPLTFAHQSEGVLFVAGRRPLDTLDRERLSHLANQGALALSHLRLFEERLREDKLALVGRIAGAIIDRVRRPVASIRQLAAGLEVDEPEYLEMISENAVRLEEMCGELSDFVAGGDELPRTECSLREVLAQLVRHHRPLLAEQGVRLLLDAPTDARLLLDERKISRAVQNLIKNAAEAMPQGGHILVGLYVEPERAVIEIADEGCGMSPEVQSQMFEPFFSHGKVNGTGLGGAVILNAVKSHGGSIEVRSAVGEGTTFRLVLPRVGAPEAG
ncbi:MAG: response regulator [Armatimonadetes bacterium]|nr:response regulator [Armatimonadota bacterium]